MICYKTYCPSASCDVTNVRKGTLVIKSVSTVERGQEIGRIPFDQPWNCVRSRQDGQYLSAHVCKFIYFFSSRE
jgi:hypothetical protein